MYAQILCPVAVQVRWTISDAISVTEGQAVRLRAEVLGIYAIPIAIGVKAIATSVQPGMEATYRLLILYTITSKYKHLVTALYLFAL